MSNAPERIWVDFDGDEESGFARTHVIFEMTGCADKDVEMVLGFTRYIRRDAITPAMAAEVLLADAEKNERIDFTSLLSGQPYGGRSGLILSLRAIATQENNT